MGSISIIRSLQPLHRSIAPRPSTFLPYQHRSRRAIGYLGHPGQERRQPKADGAQGEGATHQARPLELDKRLFSEYRMAARRRYWE